MKILAFIKKKKANSSSSAGPYLYCTVGTRAFHMSETEEFLQVVSVGLRLRSCSPRASHQLPLQFLLPEEWPELETPLSGMSPFL